MDLLRLDLVDTELLEAERVLSELEAQLSFKAPKSKGVRDRAVPPEPAARFAAGISEGSSLWPEQAEPLVFRQRSGQSFSRAARATFDPEGEESVPVEVRQEEPQVELRSALPLAERFVESGSTQRFRVRLHRAGQTTLGLRVDTRQSNAAAQVLAVLPNSASQIWNDDCRDAGKLEHVIRPGDIIVEANGIQVYSAACLKEALGATGSEDVTLTLRRKVATPEPDLSSLAPRPPPALPAVPEQSSASRAESHDLQTPAAKRYLGSLCKVHESAGKDPDVALEPPPPLPASDAALRPGRWSRAVLPCPQLLRALRQPEPTQPYLPERAPAKSQKSNTFGCEARFWQQRGGSASEAGGNLEEEESDLSPEKQMLRPSDHFLSSRGRPRAAVIAPAPSVKPRQLREAKRWLQKVAGEKKSPLAAVALASAPGLRGITSAWKALLQEENLRAEDESSCNEEEDRDVDEASTDLGSDLGSELSSLFSVSSSSSTETAPGPGAYNPSFAAVESRLGRGALGFGGYSAREPKQKEVEEGVHDEASSEASSGVSLPRSTGLLPEKHCADIASKPNCKGGKICPLPSTTPREPTASMREAEAAAKRPLSYDVWNRDAVEPSVPVPILGPGLDASVAVLETGRLERLENLQEEAPPGPGAYDLPTLVPGGQAVIIAPEPILSLQLQMRSHSEPPGPADYDCHASQAQVYPRSVSAAFGPTEGHSMDFQKAQAYTVEYSEIDPQWDAIQRRSVSAQILPEHTHSNIVAAKLARRAPNVGPGEYDVNDDLAKRLRPDLSVLPWVQKRSGIDEHTDALFNEFNMYGRRRALDGRPLLDVEADRATRRRHPEAIIRPLSEPPLRRSWAPGDIWRLYPAPPTPEPTGLASFARGLDFEAFALAKSKWRALEERHLRRLHPSGVLRYSLPDLEVTKPRVPAVDFAQLQGRPASDAGAIDDSPREGDVLLLSTHAERELFHPRVVAPVDMARQIGRQDGGTDEIDDFEELIIDPKPVQPRAPSLVDMARSRGRPEMPELDAHVWADEGHGVFTYQPTSGLTAREADAEELDLEAAAARQHLFPRAPSADFARPLGRPGVDPRVDGGKADTPWGAGRLEEDEVILTNWQEPFQAPERFRAPPLPWQQEAAAGGLEDAVLPAAEADGAGGGADDATGSGAVEAAAAQSATPEADHADVSPGGDEHDGLYE